MQLKLKWLAVVSILLIFMSCKTSNSQNKVQENKENQENVAKSENTARNDKICNFWLHSFEESNENIKVYRPKTYHFRPARAREGLEIKPNGEAVAHRSGMADEPVQIIGKWKKLRENYYEVNLSNHEKIVLEIQSLETDKMIIKNQ